MSANVEITKRQVAVLSGRIVEIPKKYPPPYKNAANGYFHDAFLDDSAISELQKIPDRLDMNDENGHVLYSLSRHFRVGLVVAFDNHQNHFDNWQDNIRLAWDTRAIVVDVVDICVGIVRLIFGDDADAAQIIDSIRNDILDLTTQLDQKSIALTGVYPNGWLAPAVRACLTE